MFVEMSAVELGEAVSVTAGNARESNPERRPIPAWWQRSTNSMNSGRTAKAARGPRSSRGGLVAPGAVEGMLHDGKQFDMRVTEIFDVGNQLVAEFSIAKPGDHDLRGPPAPGTEMDFV